MIRPDLQIIRPDLQIIRPDLQIIRPDFRIIRPDFKSTIISKSVICIYFPTEKTSRALILQMKN
jgi:hypothetical protein